MRLRTFKKTFADVFGANLPGIEFGPDDYFVVRPLSARPGIEAEEWGQRLTDLSIRLTALEKEDPKGAEKAASDAIATVTIDLLRACVIDWHLVSDEGAVPMPTSADDLRRLPTGLNASAWFEFLTSYRGDGPNPSTPA